MADEAQLRDIAYQGLTEMNDYMRLIDSSIPGEQTVAADAFWNGFIDYEGAVAAIEANPLPVEGPAAENSLYPDPNDPIGQAEGSTPPYYGLSDRRATSSPSQYLRPSADVQSADDDYQDTRNASNPDIEAEKYSSKAREYRAATRPASTRHPDAPEVTKLQRKRLKFAEKNIELDSTGTRRGKVRGAGQGLEFWDNREWIPAVYHHEIRGQLLQSTDEKGKYDDEPARGKDDLDRTAFKEEHKHWNLEDRDGRPEVLFQWDDPGDREEYRPELWIDNDRVVLSAENRPLMKWREIPLTISGQCEGMRLEAYRRLNPNISLNELRGRMPPTTCKRWGLAEKALTTPALANRMARDRCRIGAKPWCMKDGSEVKARRMLETIPVETQQEIVRTNSTRCWRDLTPAEMEFVDEVNKGTEMNMKKAGGRRLADEVHQARVRQKQLFAKGMIGDQVKTYPVVEEALQKQKGSNQKTVYPIRHYISSMAPPASDSITLSRNHQAKDRECPTSHPSMIRLSNVGTPKRPASLLLTEAAQKRQKIPIVDLLNDRSGSDKRYDNWVVDPNKDSYFQPTAVKPGHGPPGADFRYKKPSNVMETISIQEALNVSRDDYERYIGHPPVSKTSRTESYAFQLSELQASFSEELGFGDSTPILKSLEKWSGSIDSWRTLLKPLDKGYKGLLQSDRELEGDTLIDG
ncbi:MAG: hypothetical protein Q9219_002699 [cf. Caloplaca sp. 3 TL-2023]